ncbi:diguanylate cyclase [Bacteroidetes/Chlorobi group bacterium ChocPot_Mid]|jgi:predicted Fe-Mo cluster-binding NifX family protein|nr:MAG: diguanylate cyclase [Bacteroidetes/Chlorobi group bacterium ChocPot_Mid]
MKLFITVSGDSKTDTIDSGFGRCPYILIYETENDSFKFISNPHQDSQASVGASVASMAVEMNVEAVISANPGPKAFNILKDANIKIFQATANTKIKRVIAAFEKNELNQLEEYIPYQG